MRYNIYKWVYVAGLVLTMVPCYLEAQQPRERRRVLSPYLRHDRTPDGSVYIKVKDTVAFKTWFKQNLPQIMLKPGPTDYLYKVGSLTAIEWKRLQQAPQLEFAETLLRKPKPERELSGVDLSSNAITTVHHLYPALTGEGLTVSVKENGFDINDIDYRGRVLRGDAITSVDEHATAMATIIAGAGNSSPHGKGIAWKAMLASSDFTDLLPDNTDALINDGISVQNHSYGVAIENYYGIESNQYDVQGWEYAELIHVFSAGNTGDQASADGAYAGIPGFANLTGQFKMSKNTISVGGVGPTGKVEALSSRGPAYDGRIKPEIVAFGSSGTSDAAAIVSGIALMVQHAYRDKTGSLPSSSLVRAALINSADDAGRQHVDYEYGFGKANALGAVRSVNDGQYIVSSLSDGEERSFAIHVPAGVYGMKVTLTWNDRAAEAGAVRALVNDLDLTLTEAASGDIYRPWVLNDFAHSDSLTKIAWRDEDHLNNVEQVTITQPAGGLYTIKVKGFSIPEGISAFSIVYGWEDGFEWIFPRASDALHAGSSERIRWHWQDVPVTAQASWRAESDSQWHYIGDVEMHTGVFEWVMPEVNDVIRMQLVAGHEVFESEPFVVSGELRLKVGYRCDEDALLYWNALVDQYQIYKLADSFMVPAEVSADTLLQVHTATEVATQFAVAPLVQGKPGIKSRTIDYTAGDSDCYVRSFLPRALVTDSVVLDVMLGLYYGVASVTLEREAVQGFITVQTLTPVGITNFSFYDAAPLPGTNRYRVRLLRDNGNVVYSQLEAVIFTRDTDITFYPNPLRQGEPFYAIINSAVVHFRIYDTMGRLVHEVTDDGEIKMIELPGVPAGTYIIKATTDAGRVLSGKLVIQ